MKYYFKSKSKKYLLATILLLSLCPLLGLTYSSFIFSSDNYRASEMYIGSLMYGIKINDESVSKITATTQKKSKNVPSSFKKGLKKFVFVPITACLSVLFFVFLLTPSIVSNENDLRLKYMKQMSQLGPGDKLVCGNHEFMRLFDVEYIPPEQIEEVLYFSDYGYLYPSYLPEDREIRSLRLVHDDNSASYLFKEPIPYFSISMKPADGKFAGEYDTYVGKYKCLFYDNTVYGMSCSVFFEYNGTRYQVSARSKEEAIKIIEGMI